jgi:hypothetical protein
MASMAMRLCVRSALVLLALAWSSPAEGSCVSVGPVCQTWRQNAAIFDGTVRSIERMDRLEAIGVRQEKVGHRLVTFDVHESWLGGVGEQITLVLWGGYGWSRSNGFTVQVGTRYLIFASRDEHGELTASGCGESREYSRATESLAFLRSLRGPGQGGRIFGEVVLFDRSTMEPSVRRVSVPGVVRISGPEFDKTIPTDKMKFEVTGLKPGSYVIEVEGPPHLEPQEPIIAVLPDAHACQSANFYFDHRTAISGRLLDASGRPLPNRIVHAADAATWREDPLSPASAYSDERGVFVFSGLTPGNYVIGVNLRDTPSQSEPEARILYPSSDAPQAVRVSPAEHVDIGTLQLGPPLQEMPMALRLNWEDGLPVANQSVRIEDVTGGYSPARQRPVANTRTDRSGTMRVSGRATRTYIATVWVHQAGAAREVGRSAPFTAEAASQGLALAMTPMHRDLQQRERLATQFTTSSISARARSFSR